MVRGRRGLIGIVVVLLCGAVLPGTVWPAAAQQSSEPQFDLDLLWNQARVQPDDVGIACMPLDNRAATVLINPAERFPLASVAKLLIFLEYAQRVEAGTLAFNAPVAIAELNHYDVPGTNRGAHDLFLAQFPAGITSLGLWDIAATGMIQYSSNAASDYLLAQLSPVDWTRLYRTLNVTGTGTPHPLGLIPLLMNNHDTGQPSLRQVEALTRAQGEALATRFFTDDAWRQAEIAYRAERRRSFPSWNIQSAILQQLTITGSVEDFLNVMSAIYDDGGPLSENTKYLARTALRWRDNAFINNTYTEFGSKLGYYSGGTLALVAYGQPLQGSAVVSVAFFRNIPRTTYNQLLRADSIGDLAHWMNLNACAGITDKLRSG